MAVTWRSCPRPFAAPRPRGVRDDVRVRALALCIGLIPPRTMHSAADARRAARRSPRRSPRRRDRRLRGRVRSGAVRGAGRGRGAAPDRPVRLAAGRPAAGLGRERVGHAAGRGARRSAPRAGGAAECAGTSPTRTRSPRAGPARSTSCSSTGITRRTAASSTGRAGAASWPPGGRVVFHDARLDRARRARSARARRRWSRVCSAAGGTAGMGAGGRGRPHGRGGRRVNNEQSSRARLVRSNRGLTLGRGLWYGRRDMMSSVVEGAERPGSGTAPSRDADRWGFRRSYRLDLDSAGCFLPRSCRTGSFVGVQRASGAGFGASPS